MATFEEYQRQAHQVAEQVAEQLQAELIAQNHDHPAAQCRNADPDQSEQQESECQQRQQVGVVRHHRAVDHQLHEQWCGQREGLQRQCQQQDRADRARQALHPTDQCPHADPASFLARLETRVRCQFQGHAGEVFRHLVERQAALAAGRVVDHDVTAGHLGKYHVVIEVPVQDRRGLQTVQVVQVELDRARRKLQA